MQYRMKYIFKGTRDKGIEIMDAYGAYQFYELLQEGGEEIEDTYVEAKAPDVHINYEMKFNPHNKQKRKIEREDAEHQILPTYEIGKSRDADSKLIGGMWVNKIWEETKYEEIEQPELLADSIVGTELAKFLNFDIDRFINGGYVLLSDEKFLRETPMGWGKYRVCNLDDLTIRQELSSNMFFEASSDSKLQNIPYFIRMFGCKFINTQTWEYDMQEVEYIKTLQQRIKIFCEKVFFPEDENDKRTHFERYCANVENIDKKELRKRVPKDWIIPSNIEQALSYECYAMIKGNVNLFKCQNCGLYTVANDNRARLCNRLIYDGSGREEVNGGLELYDYRYHCNDEQYIKNTRMKTKDNLIATITDYEKKRLYNHISLHVDLIEIQDKLVMVFGDIIFNNEEKYQVMVQKADDDGITIEIANEYLNLISEEMDKFIKEFLGIKMKDRFSFVRKKNTAIKSLTGNIFE